MGQHLSDRYSLGFLGPLKPERVRPANQEIEGAPG
jgi:hypothetical protein